MSLVRAARGPSSRIRSVCLPFSYSRWKGGQKKKMKGGEGGLEARITRAEKYEFENLVFFLARCIFQLV